MRGPSAVAGGSDNTAALAAVHMRVAAGAGVGSLSQVEPRAARALQVADRVGAPLIPVVEMAQAASIQRRDLDAALGAAVAPARTVAIALSLLPVVAVPLLASIIEVDLVGFYTGGVGMVVGAVVLAMWMVGASVTFGMVRTAGRPRRQSWFPRVAAAASLGWVVAGPVAGSVLAIVARLTYRPMPSPPHPDLADLCELVAAALHAGLPAPAALREVAADVAPLAGDARRLALLAELGVRDLSGQAPPMLRPLATAMADARSSGGPLAPALRALANQVRADRGAATRAQAERLPAQLTFPTVLCLLPAAVLAIGAPIIHSGLSSFSGT